MKKIIVLSFLSVLPAISKASISCRQALLKGGVDSTTYHIPYLGWWDVNYVPVKEALGEIYRNQCNVEWPKINSIKCRVISQGNPYSRVCLAETRDGYFFVSKDMLDGINVIFNRWD